MASEDIARRLDLLRGVKLSEGDLERIRAELGELERALTELASFGEGIPWLAVQVQPQEHGPR